MSLFVNIRAPGGSGESERGLAYWDFERWMKEALWMEHHSLKRLREGSFTRDPKRYVK